MTVAAASVYNAATADISDLSSRYAGNPDLAPVGTGEGVPIPYLGGLAGEGSTDGGGKSKDHNTSPAMNHRSVNQASKATTPMSHKCRLSRSPRLTVFGMFS
jgi:hypothetical protein